jgi:hypothetical protein
MGRDNIEVIGRERKEEYNETGSAAQLAAEDAVKQMQRPMEDQEQPSHPPGMGGTEVVDDEARRKQRSV